MELKELVELYLTHSPSGKEENVRRIVIEELENLKIPYNIDKEGNVYNLIPDSVLLCSHMDQVSTEKINEVQIVDDIIFGSGNLGADDKNGIWINLNLLKEFKNVSFIFSTCEEAGGNIKELLEDNEEILSSIKYGLVFDRRNGSDIIGIKNEYCSKEFEDDIAKLGKKFGYKPSAGIFSDCNNLSDYISCVNLSCGYYNAHSKTEYTKISELLNALEFGKRILSKITKKYEKPEKTIFTYSYKNWNYTYNDGYKTYFCKTCDDLYYDDELKNMKCPICETEMYEIDEEEYWKKWEEEYEEEDEDEEIDYILPDYFDDIPNYNDYESYEGYRGVNYNKINRR